MNHLSEAFRGRATAWLALACVLAGCSTNAGFGTPVTGPNPETNPNPYATPQSGVAVSPPPGSEQNPAAQPSGSPSPTPTPIPNTLTIEGPVLRLAYDGGAKDPLKAARLLELSFALANTTKNAANIASVDTFADKNALGSSAVSVSAPANQTSEVAAVVIKASPDPTQLKDISVHFLDDKKKLIAEQKLDVPGIDASFTPLDEKHPKGALSIDGAQISTVSAGTGVHFDCTFALTNAGNTPVTISEFDIKPPKGDLIKLAVPVAVPVRNATGFMSIIVPYNGKKLPAGSYVITAQQGPAVVAKTSAVLL
jgi:hypothetical protein